MLELMLICAAACREAAMFFTTNPHLWLTGTERKGDMRCAIGRIQDNLPQHKINTQTIGIPNHMLITILCVPTWRDVRNGIPSTALGLPRWNDGIGRSHSKSDQQQKVNKIIAGLHLYADYFEALAEHQAELDGIQPMEPMHTIEDRIVCTNTFAEAVMSRA